MIQCLFDFLNDFGSIFRRFWVGFCGQVGTKIDQKSIKKSIIFFESNLEPTCNHIGPTYGPLCPNLAQLGANLASTWAQHGSKMRMLRTTGRPKNRSKIDQKSIKKSIIFLKSTWSQFGALLVQLMGHFVPTWPNLEPTWSQLGPNLGPKSP